MAGLQPRTIVGIRGSKPEAKFGGNFNRKNLEMTFMAKVVPSCALWALQQIVGWWVESITINLISHQVFQARGRFRISTASAEIALGCDVQRPGQPGSFSIFFWCEMGSSQQIFCIFCNFEQDFLITTTIEIKCPKLPITNRHSLFKDEKPDQ